MISILLPSRGRPDNVYRLVDSILNTCNNPKDIEIIVRLDNDDDTKNVLLDNPPKNTTIIVGDRIILTDYWNKCADIAKGDIMMICGDDIIFRTLNWDTVVNDSFDSIDDKIAYVFGDDGSVHNGKFGTHGFMHRRWYETLGYITPPYFSGDYSDTWCNDISKAVGRHIHIDILTEHMHPDFGKSSIDSTYSEKYDRIHRDNPAAIYYSDDMVSKRQNDILKLKSAISAK